MRISPVLPTQIWKHPTHGEAEVMDLSENRLMDQVLLRLRDGRFAVMAMQHSNTEPLPGWTFVRGRTTPETYEEAGARILERAMKTPPAGVPEPVWRRVVALLGERRARGEAMVGWPTSNWFVRLVTEVVCAAEGVPVPPSPCPEFPQLTVEPIRL